MFVAVFTMLMSRRRMLLGLVMLPVGVIVGRLVVMMSGRVMMSSSLTVVLNGWVFGLLWHGLVLLEWFGWK
jgi:hypothetical protein